MVIGVVIFVLCVIGIVLYFAWKHDKKREKDAVEQIDDIISNHTAYVASLTQRQRDYYSTLGDSWYRAMVQLEQRVNDLEIKDLSKG